METTAIPLKKYYKIRAVGDGGFEISVPRELVERAAARAGMEINKFLETHRVAILYDNFEDVDGAFRFEVPKEKEKNETTDSNL